jgi:hypothetical protein
MKLAVAFMLALAGAAAGASDYPTSPNERDELCQELGGSRDASARPKDLLWFSENCVCDEDVGCGYAGSQRLAGRRASFAKADARRQEAERQAAADRDAEVRKESLASCTVWIECLRAPGKDIQACQAAEAAFEYECSSGLRDFEACGLVIDALRRSPAQADCAGALKGAGPGR